MKKAPNSVRAPQKFYDKLSMPRISFAAFFVRLSDFCAARLACTQSARTAYILRMENEMSYSELKRLEVINGSDGRRLGHIIDMVFAVESGKIRGIILPYGKRGVFCKSQDLFVPWSCVQKIGEDVILVEIRDLQSGSPTCVPARSPERLPPPQKPPSDCAPPDKPDRPDCDGKCEKCMLFDCAGRWNA